MKALEDKDLLESGTDKDLLGNSVVLVVPATGSSAVADFNSLANASVKKIAIGDPDAAPCGKYTEQVFKTLGLTDKVKSKLVLGKDVRTVLTYVESGNVDAGVVYTSDAKTSDKVKVVATADDSSHDPIVYPVAVIKGSKNLTAAKAFEDFLFSDGAKAIYQKYDFPVKF
jgi:molybdate transport system substrate-binding protein